MQISTNTLYHYVLPTSENSPSEVSLYEGDPCTPSLSADALLRGLASAILEVPPCELSFGEGLHGKPFLADYPDFHFNISHSKNRIAICVAEAEVGVDVEVYREVSERLIKRCLTPKETASLSTKAEDRIRDFLKLWTQKEAYLKHDGSGITRTLNTFEVGVSEIANHMLTFAKRDAIFSLFCTEKHPRDFKIIELCEGDFSEITAGTL